MNLQDFEKFASTPDQVDPVEPPMNEMDADLSAGTNLPDEPHPLEAPMPASVQVTSMLNETTTPASPGGSTSGHALSLLDRADASLFNTRWNEIKGKFVDEPRVAVQQADVLIAELVEKFTRRLASEHSALQGKWTESNSLSTEDLRKALLDYRALFERLVG